jgi:hypothetical protein
LNFSLVKIVIAAEIIGGTNSCVARNVASGKKPDVDDLIEMLGTLCTDVPILFTEWAE